MAYFAFSHKPRHVVASDMDHPDLMAHSLFCIVAEGSVDCFLMPCVFLKALIQASSTTSQTKLPPSRLNALWRRLEMPLGRIEQMVHPYVPEGAQPAPAPPVSLVCDEVIDWERFEQESRAAQASQVAEADQPRLGDEDLVEVIPPSLWADQGW